MDITLCRKGLSSHCCCDRCLIHAYDVWPRHRMLSCGHSETRKSQTRPVPLLILVTLYRQLDEPIQQLCIGQSARFPQLGVHADLGEAWEGVDFVDVDFVGPLLQEEIDASEATEVEGGKCLDGLTT